MHAVWRYDTYPYILCGKVIGEPDDDGKVKVDGYQGFLFHPVDLISDKRGKEVMVSIMQARRLYDRKCKEIQDEIAGDLNIFQYLPVRSDG